MFHPDITAALADAHRTELLADATRRRRARRDRRATAAPTPTPRSVAGDGPTRTVRSTAA